MISNTVDGENRQTYYTNSSNIGSASGCVFLDTFAKSLEEGEGGSSSIDSARSVIALHVYAASGESVAFSIDSNEYIDDPADPRADKYFDDYENVMNAIKTEYAKIKEMGFTETEISDAEIEEMSRVFARVSSFSHYNQEDYYGENNQGRYELSSGMVVDMVHQEFVVTEDYSEQSGSGIPANWTDTNPISTLPGFEDFSSAGFDDVIDLPDGSSVDDQTGDTGGTGSSGGSDKSDGTDGSKGSGEGGSTDGTKGSGDSGKEEESPYFIEDDAVIKALFKLLTDNSEGVGYGSAAETDFKDLVMDFNQIVGKKETVADAKEYFDSVMPYIAELTGLLEEPETAIKIFKSVDVIFDAAFTNENYSVADSGNSEINAELRELRGRIDYFLKKMTALKQEMDTYNDEHPLDAGSTEVDPVWETKLEKMHALIDDFFGDYGPVGADDFIAGKLVEPDDSSGADTEPMDGPDEGLIGEVNNVIQTYPNGIPLDSEGQDKLYQAVKEFRSTVEEMMASGYTGEKLKEEFDVALPYLNKAIGLLNDTDAIQNYLGIINQSFARAFLESNGSIPESYSDEFAASISLQRGGMEKALSNIEYYNSRISSAIAANEPAAVIDSYTDKISEYVESFASATGVGSYESALALYMQEQNNTEE